MNDFIQKLKPVFKGDIADDDQTLDTFSRDASLFEIKPSLVVFPKDVGDLKNLVKFVNEENKKGANLSLTARSAGTDMTGGPLTESIVVSFTKYFNRIKEIKEIPEKRGSEIRGYAVVEPGVFYRDFEKETLRHNLLLPSYPASRELCAIGGIVANNSGGEKTLIYGKTEKYVEEIKMVLADGEEHVFKPLTLKELAQKEKTKGAEGEIYKKLHTLIEKNYDALQSAKPKVSKNSAGYVLWNVFDKERGIFDITKVIVGAQGTFGLMTEVRFALVRPKKFSRLLVIFLKDTKILPSLINHVLAFKPESFESYDDHTFKIAMKLLPDLIKKLGGNAIILGLKFLPELWMTLTGGIPKLVMMAEFTADTAEEAEKKAMEAERSLEEFRLKTEVTKTAESAQKYWVIRRESFNMLRHHIHGMRTAPFIDDLIVSPDKLPEFFPRLYGILDAYKILYTVAGHLGDGNFHIIPLMDLSQPGQKEIINELAHKVYDLIAEFKGSITAEHNDGLIRTPYLEKMYGKKIIKLFAETKKIFDPQNVFNPGKKVGGSLEYAMAHVNTKKKE